MTLHMCSSAMSFVWFKCLTLHRSTDPTMVYITHYQWCLILWLLWCMHISLILPNIVFTF